MSNYLDNYQKWLHADALSEEEKKELLAIADDKSEIELRFTSGLTFGTGDRLLTMSTCTNRSDDGRLSIQAVMVDYYLANN